MIFPVCINATDYLIIGFSVIETALKCRIGQTGRIDEKIDERISFPDQFAGLATDYDFAKRRMGFARSSADPVVSSLLLMIDFTLDGTADDQKDLVEFSQLGPIKISQVTTLDEQVCIRDQMQSLHDRDTPSTKNSPDSSRSDFEIFPGSIVRSPLPDTGVSRAEAASPLWSCSARFVPHGLDRLESQDAPLAPVFGYPKCAVRCRRPTRRGAASG